MRYPRPDRHEEILEWAKDLVPDLQMAGIGQSTDDPVWVQQCALQQHESRAP